MAVSFDCPLSLTFGAHYDNACLATASASVQPKNRDDADWFLQLSPGVRGGKASVGYGVNGFVGPCTGGLDSPMDDFVLAGKLTYLVTWNAPSYLGSEQQYLGIECEAGLAITGSIGVFRSLQPSRHGNDWVFSWSLGLGL
jgi:hypothetical protein